MTGWWKTISKRALDYYPFGITFNSYFREGGEENRYLYNGKERQDDLDLGWLDYGARMYMPDIGRFGTVDPLADLMEEYTPYHYTFNNPLNFTDPSGMYPEDWRGLTSTFVGPNGKILEHRDDGDPRIFYVSDPEGWIKGGKEKEGLSMIGLENPNYNYQAGQKIDLLNKNQNLLAPAPGAINPDYTLESLFIPVFGWLKYLKWARWFGRYGQFAFKVTAKEGNLVFYSTKIGDEIIEFGGNITKIGDKLIIKNFDIDGNLTNELGIKGIKKLINAFGKQQGVKQVVIKGAKRTTGAKPGKLTNLTFKIE